MKQSIPKLNVKVVKTYRSDSDPTYHKLQFYFDLSDVKKLPGYTPCITTPWYDASGGWEFDSDNYVNDSRDYDSWYKYISVGRIGVVYIQNYIALYVPRKGLSGYVQTEQGKHGMVISLSKLNFELIVAGVDYNNGKISGTSDVQPFSLDFTFFYKEHPEIQQTITITI